MRGGAESLPPDQRVRRGASKLTVYAFETCPSGLVTSTIWLPVWVVLPEAVSFEALANDVASAVPFNLTTAPAWNALPVTVIMKLPARNGFGVTEVITGGGFTGGGGGGAGAVIVTDAIPVSPGVVVLTACTVTVAGVGTAAGAL